MFSSSESAASSFLVSSSRFCSYLSHAAWLSEKHVVCDFEGWARCCTSQTLQPVKSLVVGLLPEVASALHLPGQELRTLGLLGECCPLVQDCLEHLPLLVQLVNDLWDKREHQMPVWEFWVRTRVDCSLESKISPWAVLPLHLHTRSQSQVFGQ